jgi:hypothetical protein
LLFCVRSFGESIVVELMFKALEGLGQVSRSKHRCDACLDGGARCCRDGLGRRKLLGYRETWRQGPHRTHRRLSTFRNLIVTTTEERMQHLVAACRSPGGGQQFFLFGTHGTIGRGPVLHHDWLNGRGEVVRRLDGTASTTV